MKSIKYVNGVHGEGKGAIESNSRAQVIWEKRGHFNYIRRERLIQKEEGENKLTTVRMSEKVKNVIIYLPKISYNKYTCII